MNKRIEQVEKLILALEKKQAKGNLSKEEESKLDNLYRELEELKWKLEIEKLKMDIEYWKEEALFYKKEAARTLLYFKVFIFSLNNTNN